MATIHWLQHVPFEGLGSMEEWLSRQGHELHCTRLWAGDLLPSPESVTRLIVMGGPMSVHDEGEYPWLAAEKDFLRGLLEQGTPILGICLGAQLLAHVLGAEVKANTEKEIGWFPVNRCVECPPSLAHVLPEQLKVFHWHGETFSLPEDSVCLYSSEACVNQAFLYGEYALGLQFHLETTRTSAAALIENCRSELVQAPWIMSEGEMLSADHEFSEINSCMQQLLQQFLKL
ncbi:MAG: type 1 glutamine amidotransferase [Thermodesulfobacteriota bacterium]